MQKEFLEKFFVLGRNEAKDIKELENKKIWALLLSVMPYKPEQTEN